MRIGRSSNRFAPMRDRDNGLSRDWGSLTKRDGWESSKRRAARIQPTRKNQQPHATSSYRCSISRPTKSPLNHNGSKSMRRASALKTLASSVGLGWRFKSLASCDWMSFSSVSCRLDGTCLVVAQRVDFGGGSVMSSVERAVRC